MKYNIAMNKPDSDANRKAILSDLQSVKITPRYSYEKIRSNAEYFVQPEGNLCEAYCAKLQLVAGKPEVFQDEQSAFARVQELIGSEVLLCNNPELMDKMKSIGVETNSDPEYARVAKFSLTTCEALVARTGSIFVSSAQIEGRRLISAAETHIVLAYESQIYPDFPEAIDVIEGRYGDTFPSQVTAITGPSRTSDIEKTLVLGAHGPKNLYVLIIRS